MIAASYFSVFRMHSGPEHNNLTDEYELQRLCLVRYNK